MAWNDTLPAVRGPCFYDAWPSSLQMEMLALGVGDVCYLLLSLWFWSSHYYRTPGQHCGLSCQSYWLPCHALRYHCLCSTSFISFNKRRWKYSTWVYAFLPFLFSFLYFLIFEIISNLRKKIIKTIHIFLPKPFQIKLQIKMPFYPYVFQCIVFLNTFKYKLIKRSGTEHLYMIGISSSNYGGWKVPRSASGSWQSEKPVV